MKTIDLTKDIDKMLQYTAEESEKELLAIEGHGRKITESNLEDQFIIGWCLECQRKHLSYLIELSSECLGAQCHAQSIWQEMRKWAEKNKIKITGAIKEGKDISQEEARQFIVDARNFRKEMEKIVLGGIDKNTKILY